MTAKFSDQNDSFILPKDRLTERQCSVIGRVAVTSSVEELAMEKILGALALKSISTRCIS